MNPAWLSWVKGGGRWLAWTVAGLMFAGPLVTRRFGVGPDGLAWMSFVDGVGRSLPWLVAALVLAGVWVGIGWAMRAPHRARQLVQLSTGLSALGLFAAGFGVVLHWLALSRTAQLQQFREQAEFLAQHPIATGASWRFGLLVASVGWSVGLSLLGVGLRRMSARADALVFLQTRVGGGQ